MPRLSDHAERRDHILAALLRIAGTRGLHAATMRTVAAEAGITVSTLQYYFHSKEELLFAGLQHLAERLSRRATAVTADSVRDAIRAWLIQLIPVDEEQRASYRVFAAYAALAFTDNALARQPYTRNTAALEDAISGRIAAAQRTGEVGADRKPQAEAATLLALATGLGDSVTAGMRPADDALTLLDYALDRLFTGA
ncbi:helix-turn-helix domain-containing protein [Micromonospora sp. NPDC052213]|uniref:TetR/AcrR family transcriptional regulator n=1 Tax=Micromonospora sp. NPDC052213 TaxID=3155812 RepID=UPI00341B8D54